MFVLQTNIRTKIQLNVSLVLMNVNNVLLKMFVSNVNLNKEKNMKDLVHVNQSTVKKHLPTIKENVENVITPVEPVLDQNQLIVSSQLIQIPYQLDTTIPKMFTMYSSLNQVRTWIPHTPN